MGLPVHIALVGAPGLTVEGKQEAGGIHVFRRDRGDVEYLGLLTQDHPKIPGTVQAGAEFGAVLSERTAPDEKPDCSQGCSQFAYPFVGIPGLDVDGVNQAGGVLELGISLTRDDSDLAIGRSRLHTLASVEAGRAPMAGDRLGETILPWYHRPWFLAGAPNATVDGKRRAGFVINIEADWDHPRSEGDLIHPGENRVPGQPQAGEQFGSALSTTIMSGGTHEHLAIGAPGKRVNGHPNAGKVYAMKFNDADYVWRFRQGFTQDSPDDGRGDPVGGHAEAGDRFGATVLFAAEYSKTNEKDLVVGAPNEDIGDVVDAGAIFGLYEGTGAHQGQTGGKPRAGNHFGAAISTNTEAGPDPYFPRRVDNEYLIGVPGANNGAGKVVYGDDTDNDLTWIAHWTLFDGSSRPGDGYGSGFDQPQSSS